MQYHQRITGGEAFTGSGATHLTVLHFWQWSSSDLLNNVLRGKLAEFVVASALGLHHTTRQEWAPYDLITPSGLTLEVKSAAYVQAWFQHKSSEIRFGIAPTRAWSAVTNASEELSRRQAHAYVFCLLSEKERARANPLELGQWRFYVLPTTVLDAACPRERSLSLRRLEGLHPTVVDYAGLAAAVASLEARCLTPSSGAGPQRERQQS